jgi:hypothetical protein
MKRSLVARAALAFYCFLPATPAQMQDRPAGLLYARDANPSVLRDTRSGFHAQVPAVAGSLTDWDAPLE